MVNDKLSSRQSRNGDEGSALYDSLREYRIFIATASVAAALFFATAAPAQAQTPLDNRLEVTRAYTPKVGRATKLPVVPDMTDTVQLRPEGRFSITPTPWQTTFPVTKFAPAQMSTASYSRPHPLYIRAGLGYGLSSTFDLYYTPISEGRRSMGVFINHRGSYSKIVNDLGIKADAVETTNGLGIFGTRRLGTRYTVSGDFGYDNRYYSYYGTGDDLSEDEISAAIRPLPGTIPGASHPLAGAFPGAFNQPLAGASHPLPGAFPGAFTRSLTRQTAATGIIYDRRTDTYSLGRVGGLVSFGDTFTDMTRFNFRVWLNTAFSHADARPQQADVDLRITMVRMLHRHHGVSLTLSERGAIDVRSASEKAHSMGGREGSNAVSFSIAPRYIFSFNDLSVTAGFNAGYIRNIAHRQHLWRFAPALDARYNLARGMFVPFITVVSRLADGSYEALSRRNPYVHIGHAGPTGTVTDLRLGFSGNIADIFTYRVSGGATWLRDYQILVAQYDVYLSVSNVAPNTYHALYTPVMFAPRGTDGMSYTIGAELGLLPLGGFSASLAANWNRVDLPGNLPGDLPDYDATLSLSYSYKGIFSISTAAHLTGDRRFLDEYRLIPPGGTIDSPSVISRSTVVSLGPEVNWTARAEVRAMERLWVFVEGRNLANRRLYSINHYSSSHAGVIAGIKIVF
jgi:hypothetical protein